MKLTSGQKKYLKKNIKTRSLSSIASTFGVEERELYSFLETRWGKDKLRDYLKNNQLNRTTESTINLKEWIIKNKYALLILALLVLGIYANSLPNDFVSDDIATIKDSAEIGTAKAFYVNPYSISLQRIFHFIIYKFVGTQPEYYRLVNIIFHLGSTWVLFFLLSLIYAHPIALISAAIFASHPLLTEGVTWISGNPYSNSTLPILLSLILYLMAKRNNNKKYYIFSIILAIISFLISQKTVIFPFFLLSYEIFIGNIKQNWKKQVPYFISMGLFVIILIKGISIRSASLSQNYYQESGTNNPLVQIPVAIASYLELSFWPKALTLYHSEVAFTPMSFVIKLSVFILFILIALISLKYKKDIAFWLSFFVISLLPTLSPLKISWIVAERYVYLGLIGLIVPTVLVIQVINKRYVKNDKAVYAFFGIIIILLSWRTINRNFDWKNQDTLWVAAAKYSPSSHQNHNNLGDMYARHGDFDKALQEFQIAIKLKPNYGDAYHNMANIYWQTGKAAEAIEGYQNALLYNANLWQSHQNLAAIYFDQNQPEKSLEEITAAIKINPSNSDLYTNLGIIYSYFNNREEAKLAFQHSLALNPNDERAKNGLLNLQNTEQLPLQSGSKKPDDK